MHLQNRSIQAPAEVALEALSLSIPAKVANELTSPNTPFTRGVGREFFQPLDLKGLGHPKDCLNQPKARSSPEVVFSF